MYGVKQTGKFKVKYCGLVTYLTEELFEMVVLEGEHNGKFIKKTFYFKKDNDYVTPLFRKEEQIEYFMKFADNSIFRIRRKRQSAV